MIERCLVDTNVLVYAYADSSAKHAVALEVMEEALRQGTAVASTQNFAEFASVSTRKVANPLAPAQARNIVLSLCESLDVLDYDARTVADALALHDRFGVHFFDALLAATMEQHGVTKIVTENAADFKGIEWLDAKNPFA